MKKIFLLLIILSNLNGQLHAQCYQDRMIQPEDSFLFESLVPYISEAHRTNYAFDDKGIFQIVRYTDRQNRKCLWVKTWIDDRYKDTQPVGWGYFFFSDIVLLYYDADADGKIIPQPVDKDFMACLEKIVADRVYIRPPKTTRYRRVRINNEVIIEVDTVKKSKLGNDSNECIFILEKDGKITRIKPV
ncbi:MAG: hypothetical protein U0Y10_27260 [Spirosomataceae bacterium]